MLSISFFQTVMSIVEMISLSAAIFHLLFTWRAVAIQLLSCVWLCNPMDCSKPGFPVLHYLLEFAQAQVHWVSDSIQPSHPLSSPSPPALNLSQHQGLFQWVGSLYQVATVLELQHQSFHWIFRVDFLEDWLVWSPCYPRKSQESSPTP